MSGGVVQLAHCEPSELAEPALRDTSVSMTGLPCLTEADLRSWEARLSAREVDLDARAAQLALADGAAGSAAELECASGSTSSRLRGLLAHAGDWTVRNGAVFARVMRPGDWTVRGGSVYARMDAEAALREEHADADGAKLDAELAFCAAAAAPAVVAAAAEAAGADAPSFLAKCRGVPTARAAPRSSLLDAGYSAAGALAGITVLAALHFGPVGAAGMLQLVASYGASAVLLYAAPASPLAQPRNLVVGNVVSAFVGVSVAQAFEHAGVPWLAPGIAVAGAIFFMALLGVTHPPGGAFSLIAVIGGPSVRSQGFLYVILPALTGSLLLLVVALLSNNLHRTRRYPLYW